MKPFADWLPFGLKRAPTMIALLCLSACSPATMIENFADDEKEQVARQDPAS